MTLFVSLDFLSLGILEVWKYITCNITKTLTKSKDNIEIVNNELFLISCIYYLYYFKIS